LTVITRRVIVAGMIQSFRCRETERIFNREASRRLPRDIQRVALRKLAMLEAAHDVRDLKVPPGNRLEELRDDRQGQYSIRINQQWRVCFRWSDGNAHDVEIVDYH
jgi:toxin HigB-1